MILEGCQAMLGSLQTSWGALSKEVLPALGEGRTSPRSADVATPKPSGTESETLNRESGDSESCYPHCAIPRLQQSSFEH